MVWGWKKLLLVIVAVGVLVSLASPFIPDPLSIPGKNVVVFAIFLMVMFVPHGWQVLGGELSPLHERVDTSAQDRLALICSRLC